MSEAGYPFEPDPRAETLANQSGSTFLARQQYPCNENGNDNLEPIDDLAPQHDLDRRESQVAHPSSCGRQKASLPSDTELDPNWQNAYDKALDTQQRRRNLAAIAVLRVEFDQTYFKKLQTCVKSGKLSQTEMLACWQAYQDKQVKIAS